MSDDSAYWRTLFHRPHNTPHFVPEPDNAVLNVRDWKRGAGGIGNSSLVLKLILARRHGRVGSSTAQEQDRASQSCSCIAK